MARSRALAAAVTAPGIGRIQQERRLWHPKRKDRPGPVGLPEWRAGWLQERRGVARQGLSRESMRAEGLGGFFADSGTDGAIMRDGGGRLSRLVESQGKISGFEIIRFKTHSFGVLVGGGAEVLAQESIAQIVMSRGGGGLQFQACANWSSACGKFSVRVKTTPRFSWAPAKSGLTAMAAE